MLRAGGNAVDAAVAVAAALAVVEPNSSGLGGVGYLLVASPGATEPEVLDFVGRAPAAATPDAFIEPGSKDHGIRSALVPGAVGGWLAALERHGRLDRSVVLAPAIRLAEDGFPVSDYLSGVIAGLSASLAPYSSTTEVFLPGGRPPRPGELLRQPDLARALRIVADGGADAFYRGPIAEALAEFSAAHGGLLSYVDLAAFEPNWERPVSVSFRGHRVYCPRPPGSGLQYLQSLAMLESAGLSGLQRGSAEYVHLLAETFKLARADRIAHTVAPGEAWQGLLTPAYARYRAAAIDPARAATTDGVRFVGAGDPTAVRAGSFADAMRESTTHFAAVDAEGYLVSCTQTIGGGPVKGFGSGVVYGSTGIVMNNFAHWFDLDPASPNVIAPGKRVEMCLAPPQVWRDGRPFAALGTPGSWGILETTPQLLLNLIEHGDNVQAAVERPRFRLFDGTRLVIEDRLPSQVYADLSRLGHAVERIGPWNPAVGGAHGVVVDPSTGTLLGGADPRRDGIALAY
nr:gamma-glutamyltransferase [Jiangella mangrovi]